MLFISSGRSSREHSTLSIPTDSISIPMKRAKGASYMSTTASTKPFVSSDMRLSMSSLFMGHRTSGGLRFFRREDSGRANISGRGITMIRAHAFTRSMEAPLTVTELNQMVRSILSSSPGINDVWVTGEISNLTRASSGHYYFVLKDATGEVRCALFKRSRERVPFEPRENMMVTAFGSADLYVQRGSYQFIVQTMRQSGIGELYKAYEELKARLQAEGLFDPSRKRELPAYPRTIGVVTSETGAVIHDIITTSESRFPADILLAPAQVQGEGAADTIVAGIELLNRVGVDVLIVGRGGGSLEDLWPFNEERVARAIAASEAPVVSAVGHETDFTIADFVADVRAPTPTGAAAMILRDRSEIRAQLDGLTAAAGKALSRVMEGMRSRFAVLDARLSPESAARDLDMRGMELDDLWNRLVRGMGSLVESMSHRLAVAEARISPQAALRDMASRGDMLESLYARLSPQSGLRMIEASRGAVDSVSSRITSAACGKVSESAARLGAASAGLESLNPTRVLERGYGIVTRPDGSVPHLGDLIVGERLDVRLMGGTARTRITDIEVDRNERS